MRAVTRAGLINAGLILVTLTGGALVPAQAQAQVQARARAEGTPAARIAPDVVLVNQPVARVCTGHTFKVGVWYQQSGGSRAYRVAVYGPHGKRIFYRHGRAPSGDWKFWRITAARTGTYRTVYSGHWNSARPSAWTKYRARTRSHRC
jgi:hypothetical protein